MLDLVKCLRTWILPALSDLYSLGRLDRALLCLHPPSCLPTCTPLLKVEPYAAYLEDS